MKSIQKLMIMIRTIMDQHRSSTILKSDMVKKMMELVKVIISLLLSNRTQVQTSIRFNDIYSIVVQLQVILSSNNNKIKMISILRWTRKKILNLLLVLNIKMLMGHLISRSVLMILTKEVLKLLLFRHKTNIINNNMSNKKSQSNNQLTK